MEWPEEFYARKRGEGCPACAAGRPDELPGAVRFFAGDVVDAYLRRTAVQRGLAFAVWRGRHVVEPTELDEAEAAAFWRELLVAGRAVIEAFRPVKLNWDILGNESPHLHVHLVPRYADDLRPGWPFPFPDPEPGPWPEDVLRADVERLRAAVAGATAAPSP